ncbi:MAG: hypothetical protein GWN00_34765, partial [Aliifodinibius sp.]|nr:hypothetical protein [Fodinibius sp.]NIV15850.1 hypothetical protein [Fodinibius sp.]NIY29764.1 hypothetical protein [Fodinibius sp.]
MRKNNRVKKRPNLHRELAPQQLEALLESTRLINSTLNLNELLITIVEVINRHVQADRTTLYLVDRENNEIWSK